MKPYDSDAANDDKDVDFEITIDKKLGFNAMSTTTRRYFTIRLWHVWGIFLAICAGTWLGILLGAWAAGWHFR